MKTFGRLILLGAAVALVGAPVSAQSFFGGEQPAPLMANFGGAIAISGGQVIVGEGGNTMRPGAVYIHEQQGGEWVQTAKLEASDGVLGDGFGSTIAVAGSQMMVAGNNGVYLFSKSGNSWSQSGMIPAMGDIAETGFGAAMAAEGDYALIGAPGVNDNTGAVMFYRREGSTWTQISELTNLDGVANDLFGSSVAFSGNMALVGAPGTENREGSVYAFQMSMDGIELVGALDTPDKARNDRFGSTVAMVNGTAFVGAPGNGAGAGAVFAFAPNDEGEWMAAGRWAAFDGQPLQGQGRRGRPGTSFGSDIAAAAGAVWVGSSQGAYIFSLDGEGNITSVSKETGEGGQFGATIEASGSLVAVAAPSANRGVGEVYLYENGAPAGMVGSTPEQFDPVTGGEVKCEGNSAVVWECSEVDLVSYTPVSDLSGDGNFGIRSNDNWGWEDPDTNRKYALVGMTDRLSFVDITDAMNPRVVGILMMTEGANGSAWRDIKTYDNHAYVVSDGAGQHGMQVFDLTRLRDHMSGDPVFFDADALYTDIASAHNVVINTDIGHAYIVGARGGGETCGGGLHIVDITTPKSPTFAGCFADPQTGRSGTGYSHDAQCLTYNGPDEDWAGRAICLGANETALSIADVTDPANTVKISNATYPNVGYSHQGWLTDDHRFFYMNDETDEIGGQTEFTRTLVWDLTDLDDPQLVKEHMGTEKTSDHNLYVAGNLMYQSNYKSGVRILDVSDPANPVEVAYFDTVPYGENDAGTSGAWSNYPYFNDGTIIATGGSEGLFILRPTVRSTIF